MENDSPLSTLRSFFQPAGEPIHWRDFADTRKPVAVLIPLAFAVIAIALSYQSVIDAYKADLRLAGDFRFLLNAGRVITDSAQSLYASPDKELWSDTHGYTFPYAYPYPPLVAIFTSFITVFDNDDLALLLFKAAVGLSTLFLAEVVSRGFENWAWRVALYVAVICWEPILLNALIGQTGMFVCALAAGGVLVFLRHREWGAVALGLMALKPTAGIAAGLIVWQATPKAWAYFFAVALAVVFLPFVWLGLDSLEQWFDWLYWRSTVDLDGGHIYNQGLSSMVNFGNIPGLVALIALFGLVLAAVRLVNIRLGMEVGTAFALLTGFLVNPHSLLYDWGVAFLAIFLLRRAKLVQPHLRDFTAGALAISLFAAGQWGWHSVSEDYTTSSLAVNPVTVWAILVNLGILAYAVWTLAKERRSPSLEPAAST